MGEEPEATVEEPEATVEEPATQTEEPEAKTEEPEAAVAEPEATVAEPEAQTEEPTAQTEEVEQLCSAVQDIAIDAAESEVAENMGDKPDLSEIASFDKTKLKKLLATSLQSIKTNLGPSGKVNMDRGSHASTKIGWAGVDVTVFLVKAEVLA